MKKWISALLEEEKIGRAAAVATMLLLLVCIAGFVLSSAVARWGSQLRKSEIIAGLTGEIGLHLQGPPQSLGKLQQGSFAEAPQQNLAETPQNAELFLRYLNALAPAVNEITVLPGRQIRSFSLLQEAAQETKVSLERFWMEDTSAAVLFLGVTAPDGQRAEQFVSLLQKTNDFSRVQIQAQPVAESQQEYTIACTFSPLF